MLTNGHACLLPLILRGINTVDLHTHTHTLLPHPPTWINSPAAPENAPAMMSPAIPSLQRHKKHLGGLSTKSKRTLSLPPLSFRPLMVIPPTDSPYTAQRELHSVLHNQVFLGFCPLAHTVHLCNNDRLSLSLSPLGDMKEADLVRKFVCSYKCFFLCARVREFVCNCARSLQSKVAV